MNLKNVISAQELLDRLPPEEAQRIRDQVDQRLREKEPPVDPKRKDEEEGG